MSKGRIPGSEGSDPVLGIPSEALALAFLLLERVLAGPGEHLSEGQAIGQFPWDMGIYSVSGIQGAHSFWASSPKSGPAHLPKLTWNG